MELTSNNSIAKTKKIILTPPSSNDGFEVNQLIKSCPPLDTNSLYCNLLQCHHFSSTSMCARYQNDLVGFVSGYIVPDQPDTLFIWQVAISDSMRGQGLAGNMILKILNNESCKNIKYLQTTVTATNKSSLRFITKLSHDLSANLKSATLFSKEKHFNHLHESEELITIGPFKQ